MLPTVTPHQIRDAMPHFEATLHQQAGLEPLPLELKVRCALAYYVLNSKVGTLEDRVYGLIAGMPIDIEEEERKSA